jgi:ubiquinol-cytochrome c reductase cytochrome b subunit
MWLKSTGGIVLMLLVVQFATGCFLAFYYVPSVDHAHTTVSFIEKVLSSGAWLRSLHHYGSQWLTLFVFLHLIQLLSGEAYRFRRAHWVAAVLLLALVMATGGTGYSLPWDARAFFSTRVAEGLVGGLPLVGRVSRLWLLAGSDISTLTLSRFFALHVLVTPFLILLVVGWRLVGQQTTCWPAITRNVIAGGVVFLALAIWALKVPAPLGPSVSEVTSEYLPRPGAQFLWLYQTLKYVPGGLGSIVGVVIPSLALLILLLLPWLDIALLRKLSTRPQFLLASLILAAAAMWIVTMTTTSYLSDRRDPRIRAQMVKQEQQEKAFREAPFKPVALKMSAGDDSEEVPNAYVRQCAVCHGPRGEGVTRGSLRFPSLIGISSKPRRTVPDIIALLNDPIVYGIEPPMRSFANKLSEDEKREIAEWVVKLK